MTLLGSWWSCIYFFSSVDVFVPRNLKFKWIVRVVIQRAAGVKHVLVLNLASFTTVLSAPWLIFPCVCLMCKMSDAREQVPASSGGGRKQWERARCGERDGDHTGHGRRGGEHRVSQMYAFVECVCSGMCKFTCPVHALFGLREMQLLASSTMPTRWTQLSFFRAG